MSISSNEFHVSREIRDKCKFSGAMFSSTGNVILRDMKNVRIFAEKLNKLYVSLGESEKRISAGNLNAMGLLDEIFHYICALYRQNKSADSFTRLLESFDSTYGKDAIDELLIEFTKEFPPLSVYRGEQTVEAYLSSSAVESKTKQVRSNRVAALEEIVMLHLANENPAFRQFSILFTDSRLARNPLYMATWDMTQAFFSKEPIFGKYNHDLITFLREPVVFSPDSLKGQLDYVRKNWLDLLGEWLKRLLAGIDTISEEEKATWNPVNGGSVEMSAYNYDNMTNEYERFSPDRDWMPKVVLMAKTVLVWLDQLSKKYKREITQLDQIPDEELDILADEGFTALWLIGIWERSRASKRIKQLCGNPEAAASAYSLDDYEIAENLGGWEALDNLRKRLQIRGIRLASDMVPNHTGMDSKWVSEHPDYFIQRRDNPFPQYTYNGENLSTDPRIGVYLEDHYYSKTDCAVVFKRVDRKTGDIRYIYHGNDGTGMPWNDTAQIDFLNAEAKEAVIQEILHVAKNFPIIRFDAAMVLAKKHIRRLWYPEPGHGGDIATRSEYALSAAKFEAAVPNEFWRDVVDRVAKEVPDTLLLAEAFWMMEGYFVRTLGMHRVYNSAFMNMLKKEENQKYRETVKNTIKFDPQVLKRFVNFMNNPDEETAVAQFGKGDKYFGVCTLMITMPGLPMFGHGQIEGFEEKYGMEYTKAYREEEPDMQLLDRHRRDIFPLLKKRYLFAQIENFLFFDVWNNGSINENVYAYSNAYGTEKAVVFYNNKYEHASGWIKQSCPYAIKTGSEENDTEGKTRSIAEGLGLSSKSDAYFIFREHHSGLWYIRKNTDIHRDGMFINLNGFEYQVLMDIREISDTPDGKYRILCESLHGRGTPDLEIEWEEIRYRKLYDALENFITTDFLKQVHEFFTSKKATAINAEKLLKTQKVAALKFYDTAKEFIPKQKASSNIRSKKHEKEISESEKQFRILKRKFLFLVKNYKQDKYSGTTQEADSMEKIVAYAKIGKVKEFISAGMDHENVIPELFISVACLGNLTEKGFARLWSFDRKLAEIIHQTGIKIQDLKHTFTRIFVLEESGKTIFTPAKLKKTEYDTAQLLTVPPYGALLSGANDFGNIRWFREETINSTLWYATILNLMGASKTKTSLIFQFYTDLMEAKNNAQYHCEAFVSALTPTVKKTKKNRK